MSEDKPPARAADLRSLTPARVALGRSGASLPLQEVLRFGLAHAQARDAVHEPFRPDEIEAGLRARGLETLQVASAATTRAEYLRRPDRGRMLAPESREALADRKGGFDLALVVADGLSSTAVHRNAVPFVAALLPHLTRLGLSLAPVVLASQARVALGDEVGALLGARMVVVLVGERPGLSSPDSLGLYLTYAPRSGLSDADRNCISNVRDGGLSPEAATFKLAWLIAEAFRRGLSGVALKDESDIAALPDAATPALPG